MPLVAPVTRTLHARAVTVPGLPRLEGVGEHARVEAIPVALEQLLGVVPALQLQEVDELRVAGLDLRPRRPVMVGQVITAAVLDRPVDEAAEIARRLLDRLGIVRRVQVEDDARVALLRPGEEALVVLLDEADGAVNNVRAALAKVLADALHEIDERIPRDVDLGDHLGAPARGAQSLVELLVIV